jgi:hypothetical protein
MAQIPFQNFAFTDPVAAQQAVQMAQIINMAQAEKDRNMAQYAQETLRQKTAQQNAARQQAMTQAQMNQQAAENERSRQARSSEVDRRIAGDRSLTEMEIAGKKDVAGMELERTKGAKANQNKFNSIASIIESDDPPTDSEFTKLIEGLDEDSVLMLKTALEQNRNTLKAIADKAKSATDYWNSIFDDVRVGEDAKFALAKQKFAEWEKAEPDGRKLIERDPSRTFRFLPKYKGPRMDTVAPVDPGPKITPIGDLLNNNPANVIQPGGMFNLKIPRQVAPEEFAIPSAMY